jgi:TatD DNase family protein
LHPIYLARHLDDHLHMLEQHLQQHAPVAVGEIGLDYYVPGLDAARQEALLVEQLKLARKYDLPVLLHVRRAQDRILKYLRQIPVRGGIAHAFNGSRQQADAFIKLGFKLGFGGAMTYSGSRRIRELAATLPLSALVLETDAPDIRPEWAQQQPNTPANLNQFAIVMAQLRKMDLNELRHALWCNTYQAIGLDACMTILPTGLNYRAEVARCAPNQRQSEPHRWHCTFIALHMSSAGHQDGGMYQAAHTRVITSRLPVNLGGEHNEKFIHCRTHHHGLWPVAGGAGHYRQHYPARTGPYRPSGRRSCQPRTDVLSRCLRAARAHGQFAPL